MDKKRVEELADRSKIRNTFVYTDFINEQTQSEISDKYKNFVTFWGGAEFAERKIARFGDDGYYGENFPLRIVRVHPLGGKFSTAMNHRDVLGALTSLGIIREKIGDIFASNLDAFVVLHSSVMQFVKENLKSIGKNLVEVTVSDSITTEFSPKTCIETIAVQSNRIDNMLKVWNLSREKATKLFADNKVFLNGAPCLKPSQSLKEGDVVSARGFGKFVFEGECGKSKKGKIYFSIRKYV